MGDIFKLRCFYRDVRVMKWLGHWPFQSKTENNIRLVVSMILMISIFIPTCIKFMEFRKDIYKMMDCIPMIMLHFGGMGKFLNYIWHKKQVTRLLTEMKYDWSHLKGKNDSAILEEHWGRDQGLSYFYASMYGTTMIYFITPLTPMVLDIILPLNESRDHIYLYLTEYFVDQNEYYYLIQLHAYLTIPVALTCLVAFDKTCAIFIHHACGMFEILKLRLQTIHNAFMVNNEKGSLQTEELLFKEIVDCIQTHNRILEFVETVDESHNLVMLLTLAGNVILITACGVAAILNQPDLLGAMRLFMFEWGSMTHLFYSCWLGHILGKQSENIFLAIYQNEWYNLPYRIRRMLTFMMMRSIIPCQITAVKFFPMSLTSFGTSVRTALSYFTLLQSMKSG